MKYSLVGKKMKIPFGGTECMSKIIRAGKEILILSLISKRPMSGYDLIKQIYVETNVFLSQGTIYPILYSFEEAGIIRAEYEKGNMRTKIYRITSFGSELVQDETDHFFQALNQFANLIDICDARNDLVLPPYVLIPEESP
jgi:DNA-binding PadR family transcriptional regulator